MQDLGLLRLREECIKDIYSIGCSLENLRILTNRIIEIDNQVKLLSSCEGLPDFCVDCHSEWMSGYQFSRRYKFLHHSTVVRIVRIMRVPYKVIGRSYFFQEKSLIAAILLGGQRTIFARSKMVRAAQKNSSLKTLMLQVSREIG